MKDSDKTKEQLISELGEARLRISELDAAQKSLRESEERFRAVFETAQDSIFMKDLSLKYVLVNPCVEKLFNLPASELVGLTDKDLFGEKIAERIWEEDHRVLSGETLEVEHSKPVNGEIHTFNIIRVPLRDCSGDITGLCGIARNVTGRKKTEEDLRETNSRLKTLIRTIPDIIYFKDINRRHAVVNSAFESMVGKKAEDIAGKTDKDIFPPGMARRCTRNDNRVFSTRKPFRLEEGAPGKDGKMMYFDTIKTPLLDEQGDVAGLVSVCRDITGRKAVEESLRESNERIHNLAVHLQSIQEEERKRIARDIHDEFGQVLTTLKYDLSWVIKNLPEDNIRLIETSKKMSTLIDRAVKTVQRISSELRPALLDELGLVAAFDWFGKDYQLRTGIKCSMVCGVDETALDKDLSTALFRAFQEAMTNVARHAGATKVSISMQEHEGKLVFRIADNGRGITRKDINGTRSYGLIGIKERFYPWRGEVEIKGIKGKGTTISIHVPLSPAKKSL